jgi:hypothetical protein
MAEVLKGYRIRMWGFQKFLDSLFALHKYADLENGRVLVRKVSGSHSFVVSFLSQKEADRFSYNFSQDPFFPNFKEFKPAPNYGAKCVPVGQLIPEHVAARLAEMLASDLDLIDRHIAEIVERDENAPSTDYVFQIPDEVKQAWLRSQAKRQKQ